MGPSLPSYSTLVSLKYENVLLARNYFITVLLNTTTKKFASVNAKHRNLHNRNSPNIYFIQYEHHLRCNYAIGRLPHTRTFYVRLKVFMVVKMSMLVFWVVTPCGLVGRYQHFGGT
jgi:hypothetical protein